MAGEWGATGGAAGTWGGDASLEKASNHSGRLLGTQCFLVAPQDQLSHKGVVQGLLVAGEGLSHALLPEVPSAHLEVGSVAGKQA